MNQTIATRGTRFAEDGFCVLPLQLPQDLVEAASAGMDAVIAGDYETGVAPVRFDQGVQDPTRLIKIDQAHWSNRAIHQLVSHPSLGRAVAGVLDAAMVQVWTVQLLFKPPGGAGRGNVGWHQDHNYWSSWWDGEVFTAWIALSDVTEDAGPMAFVPGSHTWGAIPGGDFFGSDLDALRQQMPVPPDATWAEVPAVLPPGGVSLHHKLTIHGSGPNSSSLPRRSFAVHMRSERSRPLSTEPKEHLGYLDDPERCPVICGK